MSHTDFQEILEKFKTRFPPVSDLRSASLRLTSEDIINMMLSIHPKVNIPEDGIFLSMKEMGYVYEPIEQNERISFYWLIGTL